MRQMRSSAVTVLAGALIWCALVLPSDVAEVTLGAFVRIPLAGLLVVAVLLFLPPRRRRVVATLFGAALAMVVVLKSMDLGFSAVMDRRFHALYDGPLLAAGFGVLDDAIGRVGAVAVVGVVVLVAVALLVLLVRSAQRVSRLVTDRRRVSVRAVTAVGLVWVLCAAFGLQVAGGDVASTSTARLAQEHASGLYADHRDRRAFARALDEDPFAETKGEDLLTGLRGRDVLVVFAESYGRVAVTDPEIGPGVTETLDSGTRQLREAGFSARSAYLTSPTFGAGSWLAHASLQSGLRVDHQQRYEQLLPTDRLTLTAAFDRAGWRTAFVQPAVEGGWPEGRSFYGFDTLHDAGSLGYRGPDIGWGGIPDQYTLSRFARSELAGPRDAPVMAEIDLVSSHNPWPPSPPLVDWGEVEDGSVFDCMPGCGRPTPAPSGDVRTRYGESIEYTLSTVISFVEDRGDRDLVVVLVGDHQPWSSVTGEDPSHDVPVTIIAHDPEVTGRISGWGWTSGMTPGRDAPVWPMGSFRDRFLSAFGPSSGSVPRSTRSRHSSPADQHPEQLRRRGSQGPQWPTANRWRG